MEEAATEEKRLQMEEMQKLQELQGETETKAISAQEDFNELNAKADRWLALLVKINSEMESKFLTYIPFSFLSFVRHKA